MSTEKISPCGQWLRENLSGGMASCDYVRQEATEEGFTKKELKAARIEIGVKTRHEVDTCGEPRIDNWFWYLPEDEV